MKKLSLVLVLMLTACTSTTPRSAIKTPAVHTVEMPVMPAAPAELMVAPLKPAPLVKGSAGALLQHVIEMGAYMGELENQNAAWRAWASGGSKNEP